MSIFGFLFKSGASDQSCRLDRAVRTQELVTRCVTDTATMVREKIDSKESSRCSLTEHLDKLKKEHESGEKSAVRTKECADCVFYKPGEICSCVHPNIMADVSPRFVCANWAKRP